MRLVAVCLLVACGGGSSDPGVDAGAIDQEPEICKDHCFSPTVPQTFDDCCDSVTCWIDPDTHTWQYEYCDPPPPSCADCAPGEICVERFDGTCGETYPQCVPKTVDCPQNECTPDCQAAYCGAPYQCEDRAPCGSEDPLAFTCYGP